MMLIALALAAAASSCPIENARYAMRDVPGAAARFRAVERSDDWPAGIALQVDGSTTGRSYWFLPWQGGTDGRTNLAWVREGQAARADRPTRADMEIYATDAAYRIASEVPRAGQAAPAHFFVPELEHLPDSIMPRAFFDLVGCSTPDPHEARPVIAFPPAG